MTINTVLTLLSTDRMVEYTQAGHWGTETIYQLAARHARHSPQAHAVRDRFRRLNYREMVDAADGLAADLAARGVRPGQRVAVWLPSRVEVAIAVLACSRNGYICCPSLHRDHMVGDIRALIERVSATALLAQPGYGADADRNDIFAAAEGLECLQAVYRIPAFNADGAEAPFAGLLQQGLTLGINGDPNQIMYLPFTSGTTGTPKGVMHSDNTLLANARILAKDWNFGTRSVIYTMSPLSHNLGFGAFIAAIVAGAELVVHDVPRANSLLDRLIETGATFLFGVPTHAIDLLAEMRARRMANLGTVKGFRISGAAAPAAVIWELLRHGVTPQSGYGMTETCSHQYTLPTDEPQMIAETSGRACSGYEIRIWDQDNPDLELPHGQIGQIGGRGASLMLGYYGDQQATEEAFNNSGWFMTGDLGWIDAQGYLRITGRKKDMILRGGHNIYPTHIEAAAMRHPDIDRVAAFPVADPRLGERVCLAVVMKAGRRIAPDALLAYLDGQGISKYDMPEYMLPLDALPLTPSGKIMKRDLIKAVADGELVPEPVRYQRTKIASA